MAKLSIKDKGRMEAVIAEAVEADRKRIIATFNDSNFYDSSGPVKWKDIVYAFCAMAEGKVYNKETYMWEKK